MQQLGPHTYTVNPGDTFKSIAKQLVGDARAAKQIASANGFPSEAHAPKAGIILRIPQVIPTRYKSSMIRPDQRFMTAVMGSLSPPLTMPPPPPPPPMPRRKHRAFWKMAIKIIALAAICVAAPHLAVGLLGALAGTIGAMSTSGMIATGIFAAIGDAAVQGFAIKIGAQDKFSFSEMLETGVTAGIGASLGQARDLKALAFNTLKITSGAVGTQLAELVAGQ